MVPEGATEWSSFAAIYDEARCTGVTIKYVQWLNLATTPIIPLGAIAYNPATQTANTSVAQCCESQQHVLFPFSGTVGAGFAQGTNPTAMRTWVLKVPPGTLNSSASALPCGSQWFPTTDSSTSIGTVAPYFEASGVANGVCNLRLVVFYHMEFRSRG